MIENILLEYVDNGFAYAIAIYLLYRFHTIDREYLTVLIELKNIMVKHTEQKDKALELLEKKVG